MEHAGQFYIDGAWVAPRSSQTIPVINPATEEAVTELALGGAEDVDAAVAAARKAFETFQESTKGERLDLLRAILSEYNKRFEDLAQAMSIEMGAPIVFSRENQVFIGQAHLEATIEALESFEFEKVIDHVVVRHEPVGVAGMITPWNWPMNQIVCKVAPAIAAGCTMVLKPSEIAPLSGLLFAEAVHAAGLPPGVFNMVNGDGPTVGQALAQHPDVDAMSFTGSTRAGVEVARSSAPTVKRVMQELGGKSPNVILPDADFETAVTGGMQAMIDNTGQSCDAPSRMLVPEDRMAEAMQLAAKLADETKIGDPMDEATVMGPLVSQIQYDRVQHLIEVGIAEGATVAAGGPGRPEGLNRGYFVRPTVFGNVTPEMRVAREEIFGPVLSIIGYKDETEAVRIANDTVYGLAGYVQAGSHEAAVRVANRLRVGTVTINGADWHAHAPFGGYKQSGNGREYGAWAIHDFLEIKGVVGGAAA
ncbi:MAG: aldehyde dehydrogenase family protein [Pseudomonadota bacterium]